MIKRISTLIFSSVLFSPLIADDYSFSGYGSTGYIFYDRSIIKGNKEESFYAAKLQMEIELTKHIETQLDFRAESDEHAVELREFSVKFNYLDYMNFKFGNTKLPFGAEQIESRENLVTFDRSLGHEKYSELGYGGRSIGLTAYYKYSKKREDFPYSYYVNLYRNNGLTSGAALRGAYHYNDFIFGGSYLLQYRGGRNPVNSSGFGADVTMEGEKSLISFEAAVFRDPDVSIQNIMFNDAVADQQLSAEPREEAIYSASLRLTAAYKFSTDKDIIKDIEPLYMFSVYYRDIDILGSIEMQNLVGANFYFSKQVRMRIQADVRLTKEDGQDDYETKGSRGILDLQIRF